MYSPFARRFSTICQVLSCTITLSVAVECDGETEKSPLGCSIANFTLKDHYGKSHALANYSDSQLIAVAFVGTECPLAKLYAPKLAALHEEFSLQGVTFLAIDANRQDSITEISAYARRHKLPFPILKDAGNRVADQFGAQRTPEVFLLDESRTIRYWGRIDDQYGVGVVQNSAKTQFLRNAISELLAGEDVSVTMTETVGCHIGRIKTPKPNSKVTYSNQIARVLQDHCVECHRPGQIAPFSLTDYDEVVGWADMILETVEDHRMPPWHANPKHGKFANDRQLSKEERTLIHDWVANGAPEGDENDLPEPRVFRHGWQLPREPDIVYPMSEEPFEVPAEGIVDYQFFHVDPKLQHDTWIKLADVLPGNPLVVHHAVLYLKEPESAPGRNDGALHLLVVYVPGSRLTPYPDGMAKLIPAGSQFIFEMHYTPVGSPQVDHTKLGLILEKPENVTHRVITGHALNRRFRIPPGHDNYRVDASTVRNTGETILLALQPHMHLRGKSFRYEAEYADGRREILLDVPYYDPNWQTSYRLAKPKVMPVGARIHCVAHFDNSESNVFNPDPTVAVRWGEQAWDEMMTGYIDFAIPVALASEQQEPAGPLDTIVDAAFRKKAVKIVLNLDQNGDARLNIPETLDHFSDEFEQLDTDEDGELSVYEVKQALASGLIGEATERE